MHLATYSAFRLYIYCQYMCFLGIEPTTFVLLTQCSTTEPQEHMVMVITIIIFFIFFAQTKHSRRFLKLRLNDWSHMDYFNNVCLWRYGPFM